MAEQKGRHRKRNEKTTAQGQQMFTGLGWVGDSQRISCGTNCIIQELGNLLYTLSLVHYVFSLSLPSKLQLI